MKISIITAVYNRERTIGRAIGSVAAQTYKDLEHLVIDGASKDDTLDIIERCSHPSLTVYSEPDSGIYDALNKGMRLAKGDVIGLVHSDDWLAHDDVISRVAEAFRDESIDAVYGDLDYVSAVDPSRVIRKWRSGTFSQRKLRLGWMPPHPALFVRSRVIEKFGGYDTSMRIAADYDAILRWFSQSGFRATYIPITFVKMSLGGESNRSLDRILRKSAEDYRALKANEVGGLGALAIKNLSKLPQFVSAWSNAK